MVGLILLMVWRSEIADHCVDAMLYVTTTYVSLRLGYSFKSGLENVQKIKRSINNISEEEEYYYDDDDYSLG